MELRRAAAASFWALGLGAVGALAWMPGGGPAQATPTTIGYTYDELGRVTAANYPNCVSVSYVYDSAGNRTRVAGEQPPTAFNRSKSTVKNTALTFQPGSNATDPDPGDSISVSAVGSASHGTTSYTGNQVTYTPATNYVGSDTFSYTVTDNHDCAGGGKASSTAWVTMTVTAS